MRAHSPHGWSSMASSVSGVSSASSSVRNATENEAATPTWLQSVVVVVQAEQQRADAVAVLVDAEPGHHAVGGALVLDLDQRPLVGLVRVVEPLGDDAVEAGPLERREPFGRHGAVGARRRHEDRCGCARRAAASSTRTSSARRSRNGRPSHDSSPSASRSKATNDAGVSAARRVTRDSGRVDPLQQGVEVESVAVAVGHDDLAVDDAPLGQRRPQRLDAARGSSG